jgi:hypothetical protein
MSEARQRQSRESSVRGHGAWAVLAMLTLAVPAWAELPNYTFQLQVRTNLLGNPGGAYNVDPGNLLPGSLQVPITQDRQVALRFSITPEGRRAVWWGRSGQGSRIYLLPDLGEDTLLGDPGLNSDGNIAFAVTGAATATNNGIYLLKATTPSQVRIIREPVGATDWSSLWLNESGQMGFRATISGFRAYAVVSPKGMGFEAKFLAKEKTLDGTSPYEYLYSPTLNDRGQMAGVGDLAPSSGEYFQELRIFNASGTSTRIAQSRGRDPSSPVYRFASVAPALNNNGQLAFLGTAKSPTGANLTTLWLWDGTELRVLAQNGQNGIQDVEFFPPDMNDSGLVVFRAFDSDGLRAVWVSDGQEKKRVVSEHQLLPSDLGTARVDQETPANPVFAGSPMINSRGDVSFVAGLAPENNDQVEWGTAIYIARSSLPIPGPPDAGVPDAGVPDAGVDAGSGEPPDAGVDAGSGEPPDAGVDAGPDKKPDASVDAGPDDLPDAGPRVDAGPGETPDAGDPTPPPPGQNPDSGCGCQAAPAVVLWPWLFLGLARYLAARRRRGSSRT